MHVIGVVRGGVTTICALCAEPMTTCNYGVIPCYSSTHHTNHPLVWFTNLAVRATTSTGEAAASSSPPSLAPWLPASVMWMRVGTPDRRKRGSCLRCRIK